MPKDPKQPIDTDETIVDPDKTVSLDDTLIESDQTVLEENSDKTEGKHPATPKHPGKIGHFTILGTLGEGGMGAVYLAEQKDPVKRRVALKLVHASLRSPEALTRFTAERQAMARLSHPNIAALFEAGATDDGFPYFAMENVPGDTLVRHCDKHKLDIKTRLQLFSQVCSGVQHAHQKGIMHRDLKPSNLLVAEVEGEAIPKIIDFGIAKALDEPLTAAAELTGLRAIGTPDYMSPEAIAGDPDIDTRTDIYSLGVVLYELLTGSKPNTPVSSGSSMRVNTGWVPAVQPSTRLAKLEPTNLATIAESRSLTVSELKSRLSGDLDWIVMKAIAEEPVRRYASAADFAADIARHLAFEPVLARPPSASYRTGRFVRRHRLAVAAGAMVVLALILGVVGTTLGLLRAMEAEAEARLEAQMAEQVSGFMTGLFEVSDPGEARGNTITARELLDRGARRIGMELRSQPLLQARMMGTMSDVYGKLGLYREAVDLEEETLRLREAELGPADPQVAESLNRLGDLYRQQARYEDSETAIRRAVDIREAIFGSDHPVYAESLNSMAAVKVWLEQKDEAEQYYRQAIDIREKHTNVDPADLARSLHHLGWLLVDQGRFDEAEIALQRALDIREQTLGEDHFEVADSLSVLAACYMYQGQYENAEPLMLRALEIERLVLQPDHPDIGESFLALGTLHRFQGDLIEAEDYFKRAVDLFETSLGKNHVNVARVFGDLGLTLVGLGRWGEAESVYRRQLEIYEQNFGTGHTLVGEALNNLGWVLSDGLQRYAEGEEVLRQAVAIFEALNPDDYWNALSRWSLANNLRDQDLHAEAEPFFEQALGILERTGGANRVGNPDLDQLVADYAKSLRAAGREQDALALELRFSAAEG